MTREFPRVMCAVCASPIKIAIAREGYHQREKEKLASDRPITSPLSSISNPRFLLVMEAREREADYVVLGRPQGQEEEDVFTRELLKSFVQRIEEESGAEVVLPEDLHE